jgi:hypothetical protein
MSQPNPYVVLRQKLGENPTFTPSQPRAFLGSKAPKYTAGDVANLMNLVIDKQRGIDYNPNLTYVQGANKFASKRKGWTGISGDFDNDPLTPDNVVILDKDGVPRVVDGYSIGTGIKRRNTATFLPRKTEYDSLTSDILKKQYKKYLKSKEGRESNYQDFQGWNAAHPHTESNYARLQKYYSQRLTKILNSVNIGKNQVNFIPLLSEILKSIIGLYKSQHPEIKKLTVKDYEQIANYDLENEKDLSNVIAKHLKNKGRLVQYTADPFAEPGSLAQFERGTPTVNVKSRSRQPRTMAAPDLPSFIPPSSDQQSFRDQLSGGLEDDSTLFDEV